MVEQDEFIRRIEVYLGLEMPHLEDARTIAEALGPRLIQYVSQKPDRPSPGNSTLEALLPDGAVLFFTAPWDGNSQKYRAVVLEAAERVGRRVIEVDVDDQVGESIATAYSILNIPALATGLPGHGTVTVGARDPAELAALLNE